MSDVETKDGTAFPESKLNLCEFCSWSLSRTVETEDPHWRDGKVQKQLICTNQYVPSYYVSGEVTQCEAFCLYVRDKALSPLGPEMDEEEETFKERLQQQYIKRLQKENKALRKRLKKKGKKGKKK